MRKLLENLDLPKLFLNDRGGAVQTCGEWKTRREEIKELLQREEYGYFPQTVQPEIKSEKKEERAFSGNTVHETLSFEFENDGRRHCVPVNLLYPQFAAEKIPFIVFVNFRPDIPDKYFYVEEIIEKGFGVASFCYKDVSSDSAEWDGLAEVLCKSGDRTPQTFGKLVLWSYMAQRVMDYILTLDFADKQNVAVMGHSRLGKTAMLTAAFDERFAFSCINDSGCCGAAISRGKGGEDIAFITKRFPFWFCGNFGKYANRESEMPFDQHFLLALIAPRAACVGTAELDTWADTDYQYLTCMAADEVWRLHGADGFLTDGTKPNECTNLTDGKIGFYCRTGTHFMSVRDWRIYMDFIKKHKNQRG